MRRAFLGLLCISTWCVATALHVEASRAQSAPAVVPIAHRAAHGGLSPTTDVSAPVQPVPAESRDSHDNPIETLKGLVDAALRGNVSRVPNAGPTLSHVPEQADLDSLLGRRTRRSALRAADRVQPLPQLSAGMPITGDARAPFGWRQLCGFYPAECRQPALPPERVSLDAPRWRELVAVNAAVNRRIIPMSDMDHHGMPEHWDYPMDGFGDCEDYALLKRRILMLAGWPRQALLMTVVRDIHGDGHAVLTVATDRGEFVLDNQVRLVMPWAQSGYRFVKRQSADDPNIWVSLGDADTATVVAAGAVTTRP